MAQKTAVEWLEEKMKKLTPPGYQTEISAMLEQAKQMEKEQIIDAHYVGFKNFVDTKEISEQYYNKTFGKTLKLLTFALIILSLASCNYDGKINGRKYKLEKQCLESWTRMEPRMVGKTMVMIPHKHCKTYGRTDTIWQ